LFHPLFFQGVQAISIWYLLRILYIFHSCSIPHQAIQNSIMKRLSTHHSNILISAACIRLVSIFFIAQQSDP